MKLENILIQKDLHIMIMPRYGGARAAGLSVQMKRFLLMVLMKNAETGLKRRILNNGCFGFLFMPKDCLTGIDNLDWPEGIKDMQRNWIGRSTGAEVDFSIEGLE